MNIVSINTCLDGSTGRIMRQISETMRSYGNECYTVTSYQKKHNRSIKKSKFDITIGGPFSLYLHIFLGRVTGLQGAFSIIPTLKLMRTLKKKKPEIIHLHNLHDSYINIPILFKTIKKWDIPVVWTLHDAWAFTGHCPYFTISGCSKWQTECDDCDQYMRYPKCYIDNSKRMFWLKKKYFLMLRNVNFVTPSEWLANLVKKSFLGNNSISVINNGIDLEKFFPQKRNVLKTKFQNKFLILGVSFDWSERKGLDDFIQLAHDLNDDYKIILVGIDSTMTKTLPPQIYTIEKTQNQEELAQIYSDVDIFVNPTREENYPTVNMESIACGTPVITYNTGGSPEIVSDCGMTIEYGNYEELKRSIIMYKESPEIMRNLHIKCGRRRETFDMNKKHCEYMQLYERIRNND